MAKGKKDCPNCKSVVGCRTINCACGHIFGSAVVVNGYCDPNKPREPGMYPITGNLIYTPSGKCPIKFDGSIEQYVFKIMQSRPEDRFHPAALVYWLREQTDVTQKMKDEIYNLIKA